MPMDGGCFQEKALQSSFSWFYLCRPVGNYSVKKVVLTENASPLDPKIKLES